MADYAIVRSKELGNNWSARHHVAITSPRPNEEPLVQLLQVIDKLVKLHGDDGVLREGVAQLINGATELLNGDWGQRLDMGTVDSLLAKMADRMDYDRDTETFR